MFLKRNHTLHDGKAYQSVLLVRGKRVPAKRPPGRPAAGAPPPKSVVVHETLANLSGLPADLLTLIEGYCRGSIPGAAAPVAGPVRVGPCYGLLAGLHALARQSGIVEAVGETSRTQRLALYLIYARLAHQGSRLSAARASEDHAVREVLQVGAFDEDDLYLALEHLAAHQPRIESVLAPRATPGAVFLYDVTSVYFEGRHNELAAFGYNRDGKRGKQQMVAGLLSDGAGEPLSIQLYAGNTSDPPTFLDAVEQLKVRFGTEEIAVVGDRGMIKALGKAALGEANFRYVTALTDPQVRRLLQTGVLQLDLFEDQPAEVSVGDKRYVLRRNPQTQAREQARRADQWQRVREWIQARNAEVTRQPRCQAGASLRGAEARLQTYGLKGWVSVRLEGRQVVWTEDLAAREQEAQLEGCYVIESDLPAGAAGPQAVHDRYLDLTRVERDFRTLKTGLLEIRPVFLRKANRTRGHAVVSLLALKLARELERRVAPLGLTVEDAIERLKGVRLVCLGDPDLELWRLADGYPAAQTEVLEVLPKLAAPVLSLGKANQRRLSNPRQGRPAQ
ncbi:MAG: IS1634 family transposase [Limisphaerales bacterium]